MGRRNDPYRYGYRESTTIREDGSYDFKRIPLTLEDCLHPERRDLGVDDVTEKELDKRLLLHILFWLVLSVGFLTAFFVYVAIHSSKPVELEMVAPIPLPPR